MRRIGYLKILHFGDITKKKPQEGKSFYIQKLIFTNDKRPFVNFYTFLLFIYMFFPFSLPLILLSLLFEPLKPKQKSKPFEKGLTKINRRKIKELENIL